MAFVLAGVSGCGSNVSKSNYDKIANGMTTAEVEGILGTGEKASAGVSVGSVNLSGDVYSWKDGDKEIKDSFGFCSYILEKAHVAIVPGGAFNAPKCVRIAYTNSMEKIVEGMDRIEKALSELK